MGTWTRTLRARDVFAWSFGVVIARGAEVFGTLGFHAQNPPLFSYKAKGDVMSPSSVVVQIFLLSKFKDDSQSFASRSFSK